MCDYSSYFKSHLGDHSNNVHLEKKDKHSDKAFLKKHHLIIPVLTKHINSTNQKVDKYGCNLCDYSTYDRSELANHSNDVHLGKEDLTCDHCDKVFFRESKLIAHIDRIHTNLHLQGQHVDEEMLILMQEAQKDQMFVKLIQGLQNDSRGHNNSVE
jgi:hypothetical protein